MPRELGAWPYSLHEIRETARAVGMGEMALGQIHAMRFHIRPPCNPSFLINRRCGLVSNESTRTTNWNQHRLLCQGTTFHELSERGGFQRHIPKTILLRFNHRGTGLRISGRDNTTYLAQSVFVPRNFPSFTQIRAKANFLASLPSRRLGIGMRMQLRNGAHRVVVVP